MQISNKSINTIHQAKQIKTPKQQSSGVNFGNNTQQISSFHTAGVSQVNSNLPISYTKIAEIEIPNLTEKASVFKLANGQKVIILPKKGPTQIKTTFNVGSMNETDDIRGISHYIEHNLFNGSKNLAPKEYDKKVSGMGGKTNASTDYSRTDYYMTIQLLDDNFLEEGIKLNAMQTQYPTFPIEQLEKEKEAVKSEIDLYKDNVKDVANSKMVKNLYGIDSKSTNLVLGTKQNINSFNQEKVFDYFNTWYTPDNTITVITGDVDVNETINLVSKYFNKPANYNKINQRHYQTLTYPTKAIRSDIIQKGSPISNIAMGFAVPEGTNEQDLQSIQMLLCILSSTNSRLSKALDKYGISPNFYTERLQNKPDSAHTITTSINLPEEQVEEVLKILYEEINHIANNPPSIEEFQTVQKSLLKDFDNTAEYSENINAILTTMAQKNNYNYIADSKNIMASLTPEDISNTAKKFMDLNKVSICVAHSEKTTTDKIKNNYAKANTGNANVSFGRIKQKENIKNELSKIKEFKLWNNIETAIVPAGPIGKSELTISIETDTLKDVSAPALDILYELLNRGSAQKNAFEFNKVLNQNDISIGFGAGHNGIVISSSFYDDKTQDSISLIKEVLSAPNFSETEFQRAKNNLRDYLLNERKSDVLNAKRTIFPDFKFYESTKKQLEDLEKLTLADIQNLYNRIMASSQCEVTFVAPVEEKPYLQDILHNNLSTGLPVFQQPMINRELNTKVYKPITEEKIVVDAQENAQAEITQVYTYKVSNNIDDTAKMAILQTILGAGMSSRLFVDLREKEKLAYSVGASRTQQNDTGMISLYISTTTDPETIGEGSPENAKKAIDGFKRNVELLKNQPISEEELQSAKNKYKTMLLSERESNSGLSNQTVSCNNSAYGIQHLSALWEAIDKVTVADIQATANYMFKNPPVTSIVASQKTIDALGYNQYQIK